MENIQEILFENKESIPEGIYIKLMNELKISYSNRNADDLIKLTYTRIRPRFNKYDYQYNITLIENSGLTIILKKGDFKEHSYSDDWNEKLMTKLDAIPFIPFWYDGKAEAKLFKDDGYTMEHKYLFHTIKKDNDDSDDDEWDIERDEMERNKRNIKCMICLNYDIKYLITNVEKL